MRLGCYRSVWQFSKRYLRDDRLRQAFSIQPLLVGGNPVRHHLHLRAHPLPGAAAGACISPWAAPARWSRALVRLLEDEGGEMRLNADVARIDAAGGRATGVTLASGEQLEADLVVSQRRPCRYLRAVAPGASRAGAAPDRRLSRLQLSMGLYVLYFGTTPPVSRDRASHHRVRQRLPRAARATSSRGRRLPDDFEPYLHRPTATDPSLAPEAATVSTCCAPVPNLASRTGWDESRRCGLPRPDRRTLDSACCRACRANRRRLST